MREVTALDIDPARCERIHETLGRLGLQARMCLRPTPASRPAWWDGQPFDAILLDAPCTASGIVRRHPDVRWLRRESDIAQLAAHAGRLLAVLWPLAEAGRAAALLHLFGLPCRGRGAGANVCCAQHRRRFAARARPFSAPNGGKWQCRPGQSNG